MHNKPKIIRACTVSMSIGFVSGMLADLTKRYEVVLLSSPGPEMEDAKRNGQVKCIEVPMKRRISPLKDFISLCRLIGVFKKEKPVMVHSMTPKAGLLCMAAAWLTRVPVRVHTFTGLVWPTSKGIQRLILKMTDRITCFCATHVIPEGQGVLSDLKTGKITNKEMKVLGYGNVRGIDMDRFSRRPDILELAKAIRNEDVFTFLFVGRIVGDKGINELIDAFAKLHGEYNIRLILVGSYERTLDPLLSKTQEQIDNVPDIVFVGEQFGDNLIAYYAAADCFVFPSYREGFPNTVLEAGAMGLPCIVTDINGSREIVVDGNNGIIIPPKDENALYEAMKTMVEDSVLREQMSSNARPMIESRFEQGYVRQCLYDYYDQILPH